MSTNGQISSSSANFQETHTFTSALQCVDKPSSHQRREQPSLKVPSRKCGKWKMRCYFKSYYDGPSGVHWIAAGCLGLGARSRIGATLMWISFCVHTSGARTYIRSSDVMPRCIISLVCYCTSWSKTSELMRILHFGMRFCFPKIIFAGATPCNRSPTIWMLVDWVRKSLLVLIKYD